MDDVKCAICYTNLSFPYQENKHIQAVFESKRLTDVNISKTMQHTLKIKFEHALSHINRLKPWELRLNDRDFKVNDTIKFVVLNQEGQPNGATYDRQIIAMYTDTSFGLKPGYCILTLSVIKF